MTLAYIALGSNLGKSDEIIQQAFLSLASLPNTALLKHSRLYHTAPMGPVTDQPMFTNAMACVATALGPHDLLHAIHKIEKRYGRLRAKETRWGPRLLDLDIILYGDLTIDTPELKIPHPGLHERSFVLEPLLEIAPDIFLRA